MRKGAGVRKTHLTELRQEPEQGFTLIELLMVIVLLAILAAIVIFAVQDLGGESAVTSCKGDIKTVEIAANAFDAQVGHYPKAGDNAAATPGGNQIAGGLTLAMDGLYALYTTQTNQTGGTAGPWLKDVPTNGIHYTLHLSNDGKAKITVDDYAGLDQPDCSGVQ